MDSRCLGKLRAGTYKTAKFFPTVTYTVPGGGWVNDEDDQVAFTLAPPGVPLRQVENAINIIIVWPGVEAAAMSCLSTPDTSAPSAAKPLALWFIHHTGLRVTQPRPVTVGGLRGYVVSVKLAASGGLRCGAPFRNVPLLNDLGDPRPSSGSAGQPITPSSTCSAPRARPSA